MNHSYSYCYHKPVQQAKALTLDFSGGLPHVYKGAVEAAELDPVGLGREKDRCCRLGVLKEKSNWGSKNVVICFHWLSKH